jgi:hypothetical protein
MPRRLFSSPRVRGQASLAGLRFELDAGYFLPEFDLQGMAKSTW